MNTPEVTEAEMSHILIHCDGPHHGVRKEWRDWKFGNFTRTPDGWVYTATGNHPNRGTSTYNGQLKYTWRCRCGLSVQYRATRLHQMLDKVADAGVTSLTLRGLDELRRYLPSEQTA